MTSHRQARSLLARRGELSPQDERRLQDHLQVCRECRKVAAGYAHQAELLRSLPMASPPPLLRDSVLQGIRQPSARRTTPMRLPAWFLATAVAVALAVALVHQHQGTTGRAGLAPVRPAATRAAPQASSTPVPPRTQPAQAGVKKQIARRAGGRRAYRPARPPRYVAAVPATPLLAVPQVAQQLPIPATPGGAPPPSAPPGDLTGGSSRNLVGAVTSRVAPQGQVARPQSPPMAPALGPGRSVVPRPSAARQGLGAAHSAPPSPQPRPRARVQPQPSPVLQPPAQPTPPAVAASGSPTARAGPGSAPPVAPIPVPTSVPPTPTPLPLRLPAYIPAPPEDTPTPITTTTPIP